MERLDGVVGGEIVGAGGGDGEDPGFVAEGRVVCEGGEEVIEALLDGGEVEVESVGYFAVSRG